jgi:hypothetical protein
MLPLRVVAKLQRRSAASPRPASSLRNLSWLCLSALDCSFSYAFPNFQLSTLDLPSFLSPLAATFMDLPASVANKRLTAWLCPLDATLIKNRRSGVLWSFLVAPPYRYVPPTYLLCLPLLRNCRVCTQNSYSGRAYSQRSTFKPSDDPLVPLQPNALGATIGKGARILRHPGKQLRSPRCLTVLSGHREELDLGSLCKSCLDPPF